MKQAFTPWSFRYEMSPPPPRLLVEARTVTRLGSSARDRETVCSAPTVGGDHHAALKFRGGIGETFDRSMAGVVAHWPASRRISEVAVGGRRRISPCRNGTAAGVKKNQ